MTIAYKLFNGQSGNETPSLSSVFKKVDDEIVMSIPIATDNRDYQEYLEWVAAGNTAEAAD